MKEANQTVSDPRQRVSPEPRWSAKDTEKAIERLKRLTEFDPHNNTYSNYLDALLDLRECRKALEEERARCAQIAEHMLGNPGPNAWPNVHDGKSWNAACLRIAAAIRAASRTPEDAGA